MRITSKAWELEGVPLKECVIIVFSDTASLCGRIKTDFVMSQLLPIIIIAKCLNDFLEKVWPHILDGKSILEMYTKYYTAQYFDVMNF